MTPFASGPGHNTKSPGPGEPRRTSKSVLFRVALITHKSSQPSRLSIAQECISLGPLWTICENERPRKDPTPASSHLTRFSGIFLRAWQGLRCGPDRTAASRILCPGQCRAGVAVSNHTIISVTRTSVAGKQGRLQWILRATWPPQSCLGLARATRLLSSQGLLDCINTSLKRHTENRGTTSTGKRHCPPLAYAACYTFLTVTVKTPDCTQVCASS